ncbi:AAA family ATPase [Amycolatopsis thailandensis]|uniref:AAA family ATPase n=1 Tax=Amycolatopsis thailandensis TaxID=589330 RepID=UPI0036528CCC
MTATVEDGDETTAGGQRPLPAWWVYRGTGEPHDWTPPERPPWRAFDGVVPDTATSRAVETGGRSTRVARLAEAYRAEAKEVRLVNTAIHLRRPLLVTGRPGTGKSMLAHSVAYELGLGRVLHWSITSRSTLNEGLYQYDAVGRLQAVNLLKADKSVATATPVDIGTYIRLGPLGTALLPAVRPRVLLIDEIDKGDVDLPNDLLNVFEEGTYRIPELLRLPSPEKPINVLTDDDAERVPVTGGKITCHEFPIVVMTSNGDRDFPPAFVRRCIRLKLDPPDSAKLKRIVAAHLETVSPTAEALINRVDEVRRQRPEAQLAIDQLLNAIRLETHTDHTGDAGWADVLDALLRPLNDRGQE